MYFKGILDSRDPTAGVSRPSLSREWARYLTSTVVAMPAFVILSACSGAAPTAPSQPTVQAAATQAVGAAASGAATVQAGASPAAATAVAAASPAAATAVAAASPAAATAQAGAASAVGTAVGAITAVASPSPSPSPAAQLPLRISDASLADATPWISIQNDGDAPVEVGGWLLQVGTVSAELPEEAVIQPGSALTLHAGSGMSSDDELFLGNAGTALVAAALPGAPVRLTDESGRVVAEVTVPRF
jgi:hypothetical protein